MKSSTTIVPKLVHGIDNKTLLTAVLAIFLSDSANAKKIIEVGNLLVEFSTAPNPGERDIATIVSIAVLFDLPINDFNGEAKSLLFSTLKQRVSDLLDNDDKNTLASRFAHGCLIGSLQGLLTLRSEAEPEVLETHVNDLLWFLDFLLFEARLGAMPPNISGLFSNVVGEILIIDSALRGFTKRLLHLFWNKMHRSPLNEQVGAELVEKKWYRLNLFQKARALDEFLTLK